MAARKRKPETADTKTFRAPSVRTFQEWTPRKIRMAERMAEGGNLSLAVAVCEWLLGDDDVAGALDARLDALFGLVPSFEPGVGRRKSQAVKALEAGEDYWSSYPESQLRMIHRWGLLLGIAPAAHRWEERTDHGGRWLPKPRFWHPSTLQQDQQTLEWSISNALHQRLPVTPGDGTWILHTPFGEDRPQMQGLWRSLARWVLLKHDAMGDAGKHSEQASKTVVEAPENATRQQRQEVAEDIFNSGEDAVIALAAGFTAKQLETSANFSNIYKPLVELASKAIAIRIRGGNLSSNVESGSLAAAKAQQESSERPKLRFDAESLSTTIHDQSLVWWAEYNFGDAKLAPWPKYPVEPEEDRQREAQTLSTLGEAVEKFQLAGAALDIDVLAERFQVPVQKLDESAATGRIYQYHLSFGILTVNELRARLGLPPIPGGDVRPEPAQGAGGGGDAVENRAPTPIRNTPGEGSTGPIVALASGASPTQNRGFVEGQEYVDALVESGVERFADAIEPDLKAVLDVVASASDFDDLRSRLYETFRELDPQKLTSVLERAAILGELAGMTATLQDL